jgi:hypothetical protein
MAARASERQRYRTRIQSLIAKPPSAGDGLGSELEFQAHWAKYTCVLISGYIEQAIKEIVLEHASATAAPRIRRYVEGTWPSSRNMKCDAISELLKSFDEAWDARFTSWLETAERKKEINEIIKWRNDIAHGKEANTNNVTIGSVKTKFKIACDLVDFLEVLPMADAV